MNDIKSRILEAKKNVAPLRSNRIEGEIVLMKPKLNSVMSKLMKHRGQDMIIESSKQKAEFTWLKMKEKMSYEMEFKRCQEWEKDTQRYNQLNQEEEEEFDMEDEEDKEVNQSDEDDEKTPNVNEFLDNESKEIDETEQNQVNSEDEQTKDSDEDEIDSFVSKRKRISRIVDDGDEDIKDSLDTDNQPETDTNQSIDTQMFNDAYFGNDLDLSFTTQLKANVQGTQSKPDSNVLDSQAMLALCSGTFGDDDDGDDEDGLSSEELEKNNQEKEKNEPCAPKVVGLFEEEDNNEIDEEKVINESENNNDENSDTSDEDSDEEDNITELLKKKKTKRSIQEFFENEAELSGSEDDVSSDENEDDEDDEYEQEELLEDLPSDDEIRGQLEKLHNKSMLDEEKRQLMILKDRFFEDGDLYDGKQRNKKFEWDLNQQELEEFTNVLSDSEPDDESGGEEDTQNDSKVIRLKRKIDDEVVDEVMPRPLVTEIVEALEIETTSASSNLAPVSPKKSSQKITFANFESKLYKSKARKNTAKISAFVMRDRRLMDVLSKKTEQLISNPNKKRKSNDNKSIFDLF